MGRNERKKKVIPLKNSAGDCGPDPFCHSRRSQSPEKKSVEVRGWRS